MALLLPAVGHHLACQPPPANLDVGQSDNLALLFRDSMLGYITAPAGAGGTP